MGDQRQGAPSGGVGSLAVGIPLTGDTGPPSKTDRSQNRARVVADWRNQADYKCALFLRLFARQ